MEAFQRRSEGAAGSEFETTRWSLIASARDGERQTEAIEWLCQSYWRPLYGFIRRKGYGHEDALDLTQGFFETMIDGKTFTTVSPLRGYFRAWMLAALNNYLSNAHKYATARKRGEGRRSLSLEGMDSHETWWEPPDPSLSPDLEFDRRWAIAVMEQALTAVEAEYARRSTSDQFVLLKPFLTTRTEPGGYDTIARQLNTSSNSVAVAVKRLRRRFRDQVRAAVMETVGSEEDLDSEMQHLFAALRGV